MNRWLIMLLSAAALTVTGCNKQEASTEEVPAAETTESAEQAPAADAGDTQAPAPEAAAPAAATPADGAAATPAAPGAATPETAAAGGTTAGGTQYVDVKVGTGAEATVGSTAVVHYTGTLTDGTKFDSSRDRNQPFPVTIGTTPVINGWTEGLVGMKVGGIRKLTIPADQAYGPEGKGPIPPNSTLLFEIELVDVK